MKSQHTASERFWSKVQVNSEDECWSWSGSAGRGGYGQHYIYRKMMKAHRLAWVFTNGDIPDGLHVCHKCDNPSCCNPRHMFLGTPKDNTRDMITKGRDNRHSLGGGKLYGYANPRTKLSWDQVCAIREMAQRGQSPAVIAKKFGISKSYVYEIVAFSKRTVAP